MGYTDLNWTSALDIAQLIRERELTPVEVMEQTLARIDEINPKLTAIVSLRPDLALAEAEALSVRLDRGEEVGPLAGVPIAVKDLEDAAGFPTTRGTSAFKDAPPATRDSLHTERLRAAGAIVVGKTNAPPMGAGVHSANDAFGVSRNPWNLALSPGGSSGGSAAAVAAGLVSMTTAGDGGGSTRIPAALCGAVGIKPTRGTIPSPSSGITDWVRHSSPSPMSRTVRETALHLDIVAGYDIRDPYSLPKGRDSYLSALDEHVHSIRPLRIVVSRSFGVASPSDEVLVGLEAAVAALESLGHEITDEELPLPAAERFTETTILRQAVLGLNRRIKVQQTVEEQLHTFEPWFQEVLQRGGSVSTSELTEYWAHRGALDRWARDVFSSFDLLLSPTTPTTAWPADGPDIERAVATRTIPVSFTSVFNDTGNPAIQVPVGLGSSGMPVGVQLAARHHADAQLLAVASQLEALMPMPHPPRTAAQ